MNGDVAVARVAWAVGRLCSVALESYCRCSFLILMYPWRESVAPRAISNGRRDPITHPISNMLRRCMCTDYARPCLNPVYDTLSGDATLTWSHGTHHWTQMSLSRCVHGPSHTRPHHTHHTPVRTHQTCGLRRCLDTRAYMPRLLLHLHDMYTPRLSEHGHMRSATHRGHG